VPTDIAAACDTADLEVLALEGDLPIATPAAAARRRTRRWPWATAGVAVLAGLVVLPVRANVAAGQFRRLAGVWAKAQALEPGRQKATEQLKAATVASDEAHLAHGTAALDDDVAARLQALRGHLDRWLVPDGQLERLRIVMRQAMTREVADLRVAAANLRRKASLPDSPFAPDTVIDIQMVDRQVAALRLRFGQRPLVALSPTLLSGAAADLAALNRYLDEPTGTTLATTDGSAQVRLLDIDGSRISTIDMGSDISASQVVARRGYIAVLAQTPGASLVLATNPSGSSAGPPKILARAADAIIAAAEPDRLWVATDRGAVEVDGTGAVLAGPIALPADAFLTGATTASLYSERQNGQLLVTSLAGGPSTVLANLGEVVAARGSTIAWTTATTIGGGAFAATLHLSTDAGKTSHDLGAAPDTRPLVEAIGVGPGALSPDGRYLALWWLERLANLRSTTVFGVIDLTNGHGETVTGTPDGLIPRAVTWAPDGGRVFFVRGDSSTQLWSYGPGGGRPEAVRIRDIETDNVAALASSAA
jgi:hypothetical protein